MEYQSPQGFSAPIEYPVKPWPLQRRFGFPMQQVLKGLELWSVIILCMYLCCKACSKRNTVAVERGILVAWQEGTSLLRNNDVALFIVVASVVGTLEKVVDLYFPGSYRLSRNVRRPCVRSKTGVFLP